MMRRRGTAQCRPRELKSGNNKSIKRYYGNFIKHNLNVSF